MRLLRLKVGPTAQRAYQLSGNEMNGRACPLSFAAFGGRLKVGGWVDRSACGAGAMAALTASSNCSNSTSVSAPLNLAGAGILTLGIAIFARITDALLRVMIASFSSRRMDEKKGRLCQDYSSRLSTRHSAIVRDRIPQGPLIGCVLCAQFEREPAEVRQSIGNFEFSF